MRLVSIALAALLLSSAPVHAQRHRLGTINTETPEGQALAQIGQETDEAKKLALMEDFAGKFPKHEAAGWVYEQLYQAYQKANQLEKGLAVCDKLLTLDPEDARSAHGCLKVAEATKNPDTIKTWSARGSEIARKVAASPKPKEEDEVEEWKERVEFAKQFDVYTTYTLYAAALATTDAKKKLELMEAIEQRDPKYEHLPALRDHAFRSLIAANDLAAAQAMADKMIERNLATEEMLVVSADAAFNRKDYDRAQVLAAKVMESVKTRPKPEGVSDADWEARKINLLGRAYWWEGVSLGIQNKHAQADKALREGLPYMKGNDQLLAAAYFYLGVANYRLGDKKTPDQQRLLDAIKFNEQCAAIKSPYQALAQRNLKAIRTQYRVQ